MDWTKQLGRYVIVMLLQVLLFNRLQLWGLCHPYIYVLCLLMMPITLSHSADMLIGALAGLVMDVCCNSMGIHMAGCILLMFVRPYLLGIIINDKDRLNEQISLRAIGMEAFIKYIVILVLLHHLAIFALSAWSWTHLSFVLLETLVSGLITIMLVFAYNAANYK